jgi:cobalt/nickel transport system permease protein
MKNNIPAFLLDTPSPAPEVSKVGNFKSSYIDKGIKRLSEMITTGYLEVEQTSKRGLFQNLDARIKILFLAFFIVIVSLKKTILPEASITFLIALLAALSKINLRRFYQKIIVLTFLFGFLVAFPSAFNVITPGDVIFPVAQLASSYDFWIYHIPQQIGFTRQGLDGVVMLCFRVMNSISLSLLVIYTTPFPKIIKSLQIFRIPDTFLLVISLSYKYIFVLAKAVEGMYLAGKSRMVGVERSDEARTWIAGRMVHIFRKTRLRYEEIFKAMTARGFTGEVKLSEVGRLTLFDISAGCLFLFIGILILVN